MNCPKCGSPMVVHRAQTVRGVPTVTVRCVTCGMERTIAAKEKAAGGGRI